MEKKLWRCICPLNRCSVGVEELYGKPGYTYRPNRVNQPSVEEASQAALHIMEDDLEGADKGLGSGSSSYHKVGDAPAFTRLRMEANISKMPVINSV